jgi:hypothetical protein
MMELRIHSGSPDGPLDGQISVQHQDEPMAAAGDFQSDVVGQRTGRRVDQSDHVNLPLDQNKKDEDSSKKYFSRTSSLINGNFLCK